MTGLLNKPLTESDSFEPLLEVKHVHNAESSEVYTLQLLSRYLGI